MQKAGNSFEHNGVYKEHIMTNCPCSFEMAGANSVKLFITGKGKEGA
jgi:hypothetical protein